MSILTTIAHTVRVLAADAVEQAQSGHPGLALGLRGDRHGHFCQGAAPRSDGAPLAQPGPVCLVRGPRLHAALLPCLHLAGYDLPMEELRRFRQLGSRTPGHPEYGMTPGVETTTGPLGQGLANAVGMALAEAVLAQRFNRPGLPGGGPLHLRAGQRRRHDGGRGRGSRVLGRASAPGQAHRRLRCQPHQHRRLHRPDLHGIGGGPASGPTAGMWTKWTATTWTRYREPGGRPGAGHGS